MGPAPFLRASVVSRDVAVVEGQYIRIAVVHCRRPLQVVRVGAIGHGPHHVLVLGGVHVAGHHYAIIPLFVLQMG